MIQREEKKGLLVETDNLMTVALDTELSQDLIQEGFAREFVNKVQNMRKEMDLDVMDRIRISYQASAELKRRWKTTRFYLHGDTHSTLNYRKCPAAPPGI
ncbi:MAG: hypothetical protein Ct9H300mP28_04680 [Pseudomonadota bacterium]|nr:MAG: hypothetical protein Ct9H300mP28_04680 [Pseudomonadota bacterium]